MSLSRRMDTWFVRLYRMRVPEMLILCISLGLYFLNAFRYKFPLGYAGLYTLMAERLASNNFGLPMSVPYYGPGGIPFAYPPVAFYIAAIFIKIGLPIFDYLRFAPPAFTICSLIAIYILILRLTSSRIKAIIGATLTAAASFTYDLHVPAAGMVRAPALLFGVLGLILAWETFSPQVRPRKTVVLAILAAAFLGLTAMTHLSYSAFSVLGIIAFALCSGRRPWRQRLVLCVAILAGGMVLSAPWWGTILSRFGFALFLNALQSHSNLGILSAIRQDGWRTPYGILKDLFSFNNDWEPVQLVGLEMVGMAYLLLRRRWLVPVWFLGIYLLVGESARFLAILSCIAAAEALGDLLSFAYSQEDPRRGGNLIFYPLFAALVFVVCFRDTWRDVNASKPILSDQMLAMTDWIRTQTPPDASYLYLGGNGDSVEWLPYLASRSPAVGGWGAEWTGKFDAQVLLGDQLGTCLAQQSFSCYQMVIQANGISASYLVSLPAWATLNESILADPNWQVTFQNDQFIVFGRK